jgi:L,D-transpeptidase YcbB
MFSRVTSLASHRSAGRFLFLAALGFSLLHSVNSSQAVEGDGVPDGVVDLGVVRRVEATPAALVAPPEDRTATPQAAPVDTAGSTGMPSPAVAAAESSPVVATPPAAAVAAVPTAIQELFGRMYPEAIANRQTIAGAVNRYYRARGQMPVWTTDATILDTAKKVAAILERAADEGLNPADYQVEELRNLAAQDTARARAAYELLLSEAALRYALDMQGWRIIGLQPGGNFNLTMPEKFETVLARVADAADPAGQLAALVPTTEFYSKLRRQLVVYRQLDARGTAWANVDTGPTIEPNMRDSRVIQLRARLAATDPAVRPVTGPGEDPRFYEPALVAAVKRFQTHHGLIDDGKVGEKTRTALNRSVKDRVDQIALGLDWLRTLPRGGDPAIIINIPEFRVRVLEGGREAMSMGVIIGRPARPTPILTSKVSGIIYNPSWHVPRKLAREDKLPILRQRPQTLVDQGFHVYRNSNRDEVDIMAINWHAVSADDFPFSMRQDPGPRNALGQVRLTFVNPFDVYMHDTPERNLFAQDIRAFSSGCIRLERPLDMVEYVLRYNTGWNREAIEAATRKRGTRTLNVDRPIAVQTAYMTAVAGSDGLALFREDLYGLDKYFLEAQKKRSDTIAAERNQQRRVVAAR